MAVGSLAGEIAGGRSTGGEGDLQKLDALRALKLAH
jgi:hypothetical protein